MGRRRRDGRAVREARGAATLESYRAFVDDWEAFQSAIREPEPTTLRANLVRISRDELRTRLERQGFELADVPHQSAFLRVVDGPFPVSDTLEHWSGLCYIQQTATGWAAPLLAPEPGERVLDLCSAPGGKTTHLAEVMAGRGTVVASDVNESRIRALLGNIYRLGHTNIMTVAGDGRNFPLGATFDRVMVDVPCSAEGTLRKRGGTIPGHSRKFARQVSRTQERLLRRAVELTRPGGVLLYVTCTFGPNENESVLTRVLADSPLEVEPLELPVPHARGLAGFEDETFDPRLSGAVRLYPHHLDSGGLFLCRLRKDGDGQVTGWVPVPARFPDDLNEVQGEGSAPGTGRADGGGTTGAAETDETQVAALLEEGESFIQGQLGVEPEALRRYSWLQRGNHLWAHHVDRWPLGAWEPSRAWRVVAVGLRALDLTGHGPPRPSNDLMTDLGAAITRARAELTAQEWLQLLDAREMAIPGPDGLVALCHDGQVLARGFRRGGVVRHEVPKGRLRWLRSVMASRAEDPASSGGSKG